MYSFFAGFFDSFTALHAHFPVHLFQRAAYTTPPVTQCSFSFTISSQSSYSL